MTISVRVACLRAVDGVSANCAILVQEAFEQVIAGSDTTAAAIRIIFLYIISHPRVYAKLQAEIDEAVKSGATGDSVISDAKVRQLPYLSAVVREGMRVSQSYTAGPTSSDSANARLGTPTSRQPLLAHHARGW